MHFSASTVAAAAAWFSMAGALATPGVVEAAAKTRALGRRQGEAGYWQVENRCSNTIYYTSVDQQGVVGSGYVEPGTTTLGSYAPNEDGLSVKLCATPNCGNPFQFETTVDLSNGLVYYDLSAVNGDPFINDKRGVYPSDGSGPNFECAPGSESCAFTTSTNGPVGAASDSAVIICQIC